MTVPTTTTLPQLRGAANPPLAVPASLSPIIALAHALAISARSVKGIATTRERKTGELPRGFVAAPVRAHPHLRGRRRG